jgi:hypothetical protein
MPASTVITGRMLVVDFDFFFPNPAYTHSLGCDLMLPYDWGHQENVLYRDLLWPIRAQGFTDASLPLPRCTPTTGFGDRFQLATDVLLIADSNPRSETDPTTAAASRRSSCSTPTTTAATTEPDDYRADGTTVARTGPTSPERKLTSRSATRAVPDWQQVD